MHCYSAKSVNPASNPDPAIPQSRNPPPPPPHTISQLTPIETPTTEAPSPSVLSEVSTDTNKEEPSAFNPEVEGLFNQANTLLESVTLAADSALPDDPAQLATSAKEKANLGAALEKTATPSKLDKSIPPSKVTSSPPQSKETSPTLKTTSPKLSNSPAKKKALLTTPKKSPEKTAAKPSALFLPSKPPTRLISTQPSPEKVRKRQAISVVIPMSTSSRRPMPTIADPPADTRVIVQNYPQESKSPTTAPTQLSDLMDIDHPEDQDPNEGADPSMDIEPTKLNAVEDQACRIYRQQYHMYETAKKAKQHADATRALTECQRSYQNISKKLTWQFALSINNGWNPFKEAKSAKLLAKLEGRSQPTASVSQPSGSYSSSSNHRGKRPAETQLNQLGKIAKLDTSWRETMAAARALQQARAQVLEELRKEEEASKRRKKE
ncbi:hypothetical protein PGT21_024779 [Puccinia graminis f. sp. tritici]|uniref:Uncharacterized protein n=1 Tax=Puccinia graminis f. sp. tritici TaxID=56615 RepID=A0A5B0MPK4_PUCGR|nr:hypothetical protein PGT21_024779 [Puccinia graminis f. sp. tritici]